VELEQALALIPDDSEIESNAEDFAEKLVFKFVI